MADLKLQDIREVYFQYLRDVNAGAPKHPYRPCKPLRPRKSDKSAVHPSDLARCPLAVARKRLGFPETNPKSFYEQGSLDHLLRQGVQDAIPMQEALARLGALIEFPIRAPMHVPDITLLGTLDAYFLGTETDQPINVEIKRRDEPKDGSKTLPKLSDAIQMLAYAYMTRNGDLYLHDRYGALYYSRGRTPKMYLVVMTRYTVACYELVRDPEELNIFRLVDEAGIQVLTVTWSDVARRIERLNATIKAVQKAGELADWSALTPDQFKNGEFLNHEDGWECFRWANGSKPKLYKREYKGETQRNEMVIPRCPYNCHRELESGAMVEQLPDGTFAFVKEDADESE